MTGALCSSQQISRQSQSCLSFKQCSMDSRTAPAAKQQDRAYHPSRMYLLRSLSLITLSLIQQAHDKEGGFV